MVRLPFEIGLFNAMKTAITQFLNHLSHQRRLSDHTCAAYNTDLDQFVDMVV